MKKILALIVSPRRRGNSEQLADAFLAGAAAAGHQIRKIALRDLDLKPCIACDACLSRGASCIRRDDMHQIFDAIRESDLVLIATPLYYYTFPSQIKMVFDRMYSLYSDGYPKCDAILFTTSADNNPDNFEPIDRTYRAIIKHLGWQDCGTLYAPGLTDPGEVAETEFPARAEALGRALN